MINKVSSINNTAKAGILGVLLLGAISAKATNPISLSNKNQTELVSKEGASALKSLSLQNVTQSSAKPANNPNLDRNFKKFAESAEDIQAINEALKSIYGSNGVIMGSAVVQHEIDRQMLGVLVDCNTEILTKNNINPELGRKINEIGPKFYNSVRPNGQNFMNYLDNNYTPIVLDLLKSDHKLNGKEAIERMDYIAEKKIGFNLDDIVEYHTYSDSFKRNKLNNRTDDKAMADLTAYKMFLIDRIFLKKVLENKGFFDKQYMFNKYEGLKDYYKKWMESVEPRVNK